MPELPEVETIRRGLAKTIKGKKIKNVEIRYGKTIKNISINDFKKAVEGQRIVSVKRRAKILLIELSSKSYLMIHLKLTGQILYRPSTEEIDKHTHVIFNFDDGWSLFYRDVRKFGYIRLVQEKDLKVLKEFNEFGPEPLDKDFTEEKFLSMLEKKKKSKIKMILMDQTFLAGVGNVYACEILFYARVHPERIVQSLSKKEIKKIYEGIREILPLAIKYRGSSVDSYVDINGRDGGFVPHLKVYNRENKPCITCQTQIKRISLGGRGTYFCPKCQK